MGTARVVHRVAASPTNIARIAARLGSAVCAASVVLLTVLLGAATLRAELGGAVELNRLQSQFRNVADQVAPSVMAISVALSPTDSDDALRTDAMNGDKLQRVLSRTTRTVGTGFVIDPDGYLLTNEHVIGDAAQIWVTTDTGTVYPAVVLGSDPRADLAVLKIPAHDLHPVTFTDPGKAVDRGNWTIALGNPYGYAASGEMSMSVGIISALHRSLPKLNSQENRFYTDLIQTTAEINPGNSGGPLFDIDGKVIGISTAVILPQKQTNGIGFAMPITQDVLDRIRDLKDGKETVYAYLGVMVTTPTPRQRRAAGAPETSGVIIDSVEKGSPGDDKLDGGDMVISIDDKPVRDGDEFVRIIGGASVQHPTKFVVRRDGSTLNLDVLLRQRELPSVAVCRAKQRIRWRGMLLGPIPANWDPADQSKQPQQAQAQQPPQEQQATFKPDHGLMVLGIDSDNAFFKQGIR
ncbi:MAG TPA: trypsin-like peptidase domain-containing protein, partial [Tepidisphaeraceae bacterium]